MDVQTVVTVLLVVRTWSGDHRIDAQAPQLARELRAAPPEGIGWLLFLGVFPTTIAFTTWAYALARGSAGRLAATAYLTGG